MKWQFEHKATEGRFTLSSDEPSLCGRGLLNEKSEMISTIIFNPQQEQTVTIDNINYILPANSILPLVANQIFSFETPANLVAWQFNREFYCIVDHDAEVGCVGFLFYGIRHPFFIRLSTDGSQTVSSLQQQCVEDMLVEDRVQGEMLRTVLKRLIIFITRIAKEQTENYKIQTSGRMDVIRQFNLLLELNFRSEHEVQFYARRMYKSPKTLSNIFGLCNYPSPSELIRRRILLEARRYVFFTDKSAKEVAENLGFASAAHFSRFFKAGTGRNFSEFRTLA
jgi:AraC family transcriptional activator of pobA